MSLWIHFDVTPIWLWFLLISLRCHFDFTLIHYDVTLVSFRQHFGFTLIPRWFHCYVALISCWFRFDVTSICLRCNFAVIAISLWCHFGFILTSLWFRSNLFWFPFDFTLLSRWLHFDFTLISLWFHFELELVWFHAISLCFPRVRGKAPTSTREKGKPPVAKREKGKHTGQHLRWISTWQPHRAHARTTRNDFPVTGGRPKGDPTPPNLRFLRGPTLHLLRRRTCRTLETHNFDITRTINKWVPETHS